MATLADAYVRIRPDTSGLDTDGISRPASEMGRKAGEAAGKSFNTGFSTLVKAAAVAATAIAGSQITSFFKQTVTAASDVAESTSKIKVVFGDSTKAVLDFGKQSSTTMGISQRTYREAVGTLGNLFVALKLPGPQAAKMSTDMVKLAGDLASFNNVKPEQALEALRSGLVGETEPLRNFGVNLNDATVRTQAMKMGLIEHINDALTPAQRATATYALILDQTKTAQGDFARTSSGLANSQRIVAAQFEDLKQKIGEQFLPIATKAFAYIKSDVVPALSAFADGLFGVDSKAGGMIGNLNDAGQTIRAFFDGLRGGKSDLDGAAGSMNSLGLAIRDVTTWLVNNKDIVLTSIIAYGTYVTTMKAIEIGTKAWAAAQALLNGALLANPIGLVVATVVGFIAIWVTAYNRVEWFHDAVNWWFGHLYDLAVWFVNGWKDALNDAMPFLKWFGDGWVKTFTDASKATSDFTSWFTSNWGKVFADARPPAEGFMTWFVTGWSQTFSSAKTTFNDFDVWFTQGWAATLNDAKSAYTSFDVWFTQGWRQTFASARTEGSAFFTWFTTGWAATLNEARSAITGFFSWFISGWTSALADARNTIGGFWTWFTNGWTSTLNAAASAVSAGVNAIGRFWDGLREKVRAPIAITVGFINRGIIDPVNSLVGVFGGTRLNPITGFRDGGVIPGSVRNDGILGLSAGGVPTARVESGEFVVNRAQTAKHLNLLKSLNSGVDGFADGGLIGDALGLITDPVGTMSRGLDSLGLNGNAFERTLAGVPRKLIEWAAKWIKDKFTNLLGGGAPALGGPGGNSAAAILAWARMFDPTASISSGYRPGAADYHGAGLAADIIGANMDGIAAGFYNMSGRLLELIHSPSWFVKNGVRVPASYYASEIAGHYNHVHVAAYANALGFANGGVINEPIWGVGKSGRRYTFGERGPETITPGVGGPGGFQFTVNVHGDVSDAHVQQIRRHVDDAFSKFYVQLKTGRRR